MFLFQNGTVIANNSDIIIEFNDEALLCFTDHKNCCTSDTAQVAGNWYFPGANGSIVGNQSTSNNIYIERGLSVVGLYWNDSAIIPTGVFRCEIPDARGVTQNVIVNVRQDVDTTSNSYMMQDTTSGSPEALVAGTVVGVLLIVILVIAVLALVVVFQMRR